MSDENTVLMYQDDIEEKIQEAITLFNDLLKTSRHCQKNLLEQVIITTVYELCAKETLDKIVENHRNLKKLKQVVIKIFNNANKQVLTDN